MRLLRVIGLWGPVVGFMALLYALSAESDLPLVENVSDKLLHTGAYGCLAALCLRAFHGGLRGLASKAVLMALGLTMIYATVDELHQSQVPGRDASLLDWLADLLGALLAVPCFAVLVRCVRRAGEVRGRR